MARQETETSGLNREAVVQAALEMLDAVGVDGLSMRALADRLGVKAASLYWHLRDKDQLLELVAEAVLDRVVVPVSPRSWRHRSPTHATTWPLSWSTIGLPRRVVLGLAAGGPAQPPDARPGSRPCGRRPGGRRERRVHVGGRGCGVGVFTPSATARKQGGQVMTLAIDSGSWRVLVRAAPPGAVDLATSVGGGGAASVEVRPGSLVLVKNRRGGDHGAVELNPDHTWYFKIHGGTWNTVLDLSGLRVSGVELDSGAGNVTCTLPAPSGVVPIRVNSGIVGVTLHRPQNTAVHAIAVVRVCEGAHGRQAHPGDDIRYSVGHAGSDAQPGSIRPHRVQRLRSGDHGHGCPGCCADSAATAVRHERRLDMASRRGRQSRPRRHRETPERVAHRLRHQALPPRHSLRSWISHAWSSACQARRRAQ